MNFLNQWTRLICGLGIVFLLCIAFVVSAIAYFGLEKAATQAATVFRRPCPPSRSDDKDPKRYEAIVRGLTVEEAKQRFPEDAFRVVGEDGKNFVVTQELVIGSCPHMNRVNVVLQSGRIERVVDLG